MSKGKRYSPNVLRHTINRKRYKRMNRVPQKRFSPSNHSQKCWFSICAHLSEHELDFRMLIARNRDQHNETDHRRMVEPGRGSPSSRFHIIMPRFVRAARTGGPAARSSTDGQASALDRVHVVAACRGLFFFSSARTRKSPPQPGPPIETYVHIELYDCPHTLM